MKLSHAAIHVAEIVVGVGEAFLVAVLLADGLGLEMVVERISEAAEIRFGHLMGVVALRFAPSIAGLAVELDRFQRFAPRLFQQTLAAVSVGEVVQRFGLAA